MYQWGLLESVVTPDDGLAVPASGERPDS
jgi:hypothetical protein